ncbi:MAG TPA: VOC family protein [Myxococcota bacterium]|nr:VOC family protein [Myxococcota bacterium]
MKFAGVHLYVRDLARSLAFYRLLGLSLPEPEPGGVFASTAVGKDVHLAFGTFELTRGYDPGFREPRGGPTNSLQFDVESRADVDRIHARLISAGYASHLAPHDAFWGSRYAEVEDPDGNTVGFQSPVDEARRSRPPGV